MARRSRLPWLGLWMLVASCANTTTTRNPVGPLPQRPSFSARVTLRGPSIPTGIRQYAAAWARRMMILGVTSEWIFDRDMAIVDLDGVPQERLDHVIAALVEPGGWRLGSLWLDRASVTQWRLPEHDCECTAIVRIAGDRSLLEALHTGGGGGQLTRGAGELLLGRTPESGGRPLGVGSAVVHWVMPEDGLPYPDWADLRIDATGSDAADVVLAIGGGALPGAVQVLSVEPAGGAR